MAVIAVYRTATIPAVADGDSVEFEDGTTPVTAGLDLSTLVEGVSGITVSRNWAADIGSSTSPLLADVDSGAGATFTYNAGGGACYYTPKGDNNLCLKMQCTGFGTMVLTGTGTVTQLEVATRARVVIGASIVVTTLYIAQGTVEIQGPSGTAPTTIHMMGGSLITERGVTTLNLNGGTATFNAASNAITTVNANGGTLNVQRSGTITTLTWLGGSAFNVNVGKSITITNSTLSGAVPQAAAFSRHPKITFTNASTWLFGQGGNF